MRLWKDFDGEPFLINPHLVIAGNPKGGRKMARRKLVYDSAGNEMGYVEGKAPVRRRKLNPSGVKKMATRRRATRTRYRRPRRVASARQRIARTTRRVARGGYRAAATARPRRNPPKRQTYRRRNYYTAGPTTNPRRRRRRTYRRKNYYTRTSPMMRNPRVFGVELPPLRAALFTAGGFVVPSIIETYVAPMLPPALTQNTFGRWAVKLGSVAATGMLARAVVGRREGQAVLIGGGAWLLLQVVQEFMPGMIPGVGAQPFLGRYPRRRSGLRGNGNGMQVLPATCSPTPFSMRGVPERLSPASRF